MPGRGQSFGSVQGLVVIDSLGLSSAEIFSNFLKTFRLLLYKYRLNFVTRHDSVIIMKTIVVFFLNNTFYSHGLKEALI